MHPKSNMEGLACSVALDMLVGVGTPWKRVLSCVRVAAQILLGEVLGISALLRGLKQNGLGTHFKAESPLSVYALILVLLCGVQQ